MNTVKPSCLIRSISIGVLTLSAVIIQSCQGKTEKAETGAELSGKSGIQYAKRLVIEKKDSYSQVRIINPWQGAKGEEQNWFLISDSADIPPFINPTEVIRVPVKRIICTSTTHLSMLSAIGGSGSVKGFSGTGLLYSQEYNDRISAKTINEIGYDDNLNKEMMIKLKPDIVMMYGVGGESASFAGKLKEMGLKVMFNADYLETDPLGKAEWIKLFGALYSKEETADSIFRCIEHDYKDTEAFIRKNVKEHPKVLLGLPFRDTWYISPGNSYISELIKDAGGEYLWSDTESDESIPMGLENVYIKALTADYWLNTGTAETLSQVSSIDSRFAGLPCYRNGNVFNNIKRTNKQGGNDYWESGTLSPHILLDDLASILHPELFPGRELYFYRKLN
ncbi:MAG TPA: ABC transporter substrate-binding protein [Bacteroidales bacterium]|jgi:iron complex transport system substrate-binding protein|nr:ABC transporter substrate-binding protein [Bacteroidales bacterium]